MVAIEKGELQGIFGDSWGDIRTQKPDWIDNHLVHIIVQTGNHKSPDLPDVPLLKDQAKTDNDRQLLAFLLARQEFSRPYIAPPGVPSDRLEVLRRAFDATVHDPQFLDALHSIRLTAENPMTGEALAKRVSDLSKTSQAVKDRLTKIFADYLAQEH
jgi:tripartite-type tricarboxylate transporter receptor subunit TctC